MALPFEKIGEYKIVQPLGKGGMGDVYLAQDPAIGRLVAIKLLKDGLDDPEQRERFSREARSAGRLRHPNIVTLFHVGEHENRPYIVMEYIPGDTLAEVINRRLDLTLTRKLRIIEDLCRGLGHAHRFGVVHRDIKPANVIVDSDGMVKILDFGIARVENQNLTRLGMLVGTPNYMSPEQIVNPGTADQRSDVWSVGLVFYELLTYHRAFPGDGYTVLNNIVNGQLEPIESLLPALDPEVANILRRAVEKDPVKRYQDVGPFRSDLSKSRLRLHTTSGTDEAADEGPVSESAVAAEMPTTVQAAPAGPVSGHVTVARQAFAAQEYERAIRECDLALAADSGNMDASSLRNEAQRALDLSIGRRLVSSGQSAFGRGDLSSALDVIGKVDAMRLSGEGSTEIMHDLDALRRGIESMRKSARVMQLVEAGRRHLGSGALDQALAAVNEAAVDGPNDPQVARLRDDVLEAFNRRDREAAASSDATAVLIPGSPTPAPSEATVVVQPRTAISAAPPSARQTAPTVPAPTAITPPPQPPAPHAPLPSPAPPDDEGREAVTQPASRGESRKLTWLVVPVAAASVLTIAGIVGWRMLSSGEKTNQITGVTNSISAPPATLAPTTVPATVPATAPATVPATVPATTTIPAVTSVVPTSAPTTIPARLGRGDGGTQGTRGQRPPETTQPIQLTTTPVAPTIPATTSAPRTTSAATSVATSIATTSVPAGPGGPANENAAIQRALDAFAEGFRRMDPDAIRRVYPRSPANFSDMRSYEIQLSDVQISLNGDRATVTARRFIRQTNRSGKPQEINSRATFQMRKDGTAWIIEAIR